MQENDIPNVRGKKEIVNGLVVDNQGFHLDENFLEKSILKAAQVGGSDNGEEGSDSNIDEGLVVEGKSEIIDGVLIDQSGVHLNKNDFISSLSSSLGIKQSNNDKNKGKVPQKTASIDLGMYQPVWEELQQIPFSDNFEQEMITIAKAVKNASKDIKVKRIIANTKSIAKNAQKFYYTDMGMRVVFSILGNRFSMAAKGDFTGMEAFYIQVNGDSLDGVILKKENDGNFKDVTENYKIDIKREE